jgi:hypothetical protein
MKEEVNEHAGASTILTLHEHQAFKQGEILLVLEQGTRERG